MAWTEELATGIREIDEQHRDLFANVAALRDSMRLGNVNSAGRTLSFLERYVQDHFANEERWMSSTQYPGLPTHRAAHEAFVREFLERKARFEQKGSTASLVLDISEWLGGWLQDHVAHLDRAMGGHLRERLPAAVVGASRS